MDDTCECTESYQCEATLNAMKNSGLRLLQHLCCDNESKYPNLERVQCECEESIDCGIGKVLRLLNSSCITLQSTDTMGFKRIIKLEHVHKNRTRKAHANMYEQCSWKSFKDLFITEFIEYTKHHNAWIHQHQTRRDFVLKKFGTLPKDACYCHFDFIHNVAVHYSTVSNGM